MKLCCHIYVDDFIINRKKCDLLIRGMVTLMGNRIEDSSCWEIYGDLIDETDPWLARTVVALKSIRSSRVF